MLFLLNLAPIQHKNSKILHSLLYFILFFWFFANSSPPRWMLSPIRPPPIYASVYIWSFLYDIDTTATCSLLAFLHPAIIFMMSTLRWESKDPPLIHPIRFWCTTDSCSCAHDRQCNHGLRFCCRRELHSRKCCFQLNCWLNINMSWK